MTKSRRYPVVATSNASQVGTHYTPYVTGYIESIQYVKDGTTPYTDGVDVTFSSEATGEVILTATNLNASAFLRPSAATHSTAGVAALYAAAGVAVNDRIAVGRDRVKIVLAQAGANKTGTFYITVTDD